MGDWIIQFTKTVDISETYIALLISFLISTIFLSLSVYIFRRTNYTKRGILQTTILGGLFTSIWSVITGQILLFFGNSTALGNFDGWYAILSLFHSSSFLTKSVIYLKYYEICEYIESLIFLLPHPSMSWDSWVWSFSPTYVLSFLFGVLGFFATAVALKILQNRHEFSLRIEGAALFTAGFIIIFASISLAVFYQTQLFAVG